MVLNLYLSTLYAFFFFKQKTAYGMRISDWSSDVCSSDLIGRAGRGPGRREAGGAPEGPRRVGEGGADAEDAPGRVEQDRSMPRVEIGRASCGERVCQYVSLPVVAVSLKKK